MEVGAGVTGFATGDRVASNGKHAEVVSVPATFAPGFPIACPMTLPLSLCSALSRLQGIRLVAPTLGETIAVTGLGLIGLLTVQLLRAHGCRVHGLDFDRGQAGAG